MAASDAGRFARVAGRVDSGATAAAGRCDASLATAALTLGKRRGYQGYRTTGGSWYTYVAAWMNPAKTTKGVVAYKPKEGIVPAVRAPVVRA